MDGCTTAICFDSRRKKEAFQGVYCNENYAMCEIYRMLMREKYPEE